MKFIGSLLENTAPIVAVFVVAAIEDVGYAGRAASATSARMLTRPGRPHLGDGHVNYWHWKTVGSGR